MTSETFGIGELARATGTKVETIRWYERIGLLAAPARTGGNYRAYGRAHLERLSFVRRARDLGFSLDQVRELLRLSDQRDRPCEEVDLIARGHLAEVERKVADLTALGHELSQIIGQCRHGTVAECRIIEALAPVAPEATSAAGVNNGASAQEAGRNRGHIRRDTTGLRAVRPHFQHHRSDGE